MKVGFTGTQRGMTRQQRRVLSWWLDSHDVEEMHHGDCVGADEEMHLLAREHRIPVVTHPPLNESRRAFCRVPGDRPAKEYLSRNRDIVDETDMLVATPATRDEVARSGTWMTIRYAKRRGKPVWVIPPSKEIP